MGPEVSLSGLRNSVKTRRVLGIVRELETDKYTLQYSKWTKDFPGSPVVMNLPSNAGDLGVIPGQGMRKVASQVALVLRNLPANIGDKRDAGLIPWWGRSPGEVNGTLLQHSCLENSMGREAWWAIVHQAPKNQIRLSD